MASRKLRRTRVVPAAVALGAVSLAGAPAAAAAPAVDAGLVVSTPFPSIETEPGSSVKVDLDVSTATIEPVQLTVDGLDPGWSATLRGGGFVIHQLTSSPEGASADLDLDVPPDATPGEHHVSVVASDAAGARSEIDLVLLVAERVDNGISLTTDFPSLSGEPGSTFAYTLQVTNDTPIEQTFTFDPTAPQGWEVTASPTAEAKAQTVTIDAGGEAGIKVSAVAPATAEEGVYPVDVSVVGASGASGTLTLQAEIVGTPKLGLATADQRLDVSGPANREKRVPMLISNTGTAELDGVKLAGTAPTDWDVAFDPQQIDAIQPGETAQVTAIITPSTSAVAGDYSMTVRANAGSLSSDVDLRYTVEASRTLGIVAIGVIAAAFIGLAGVFVKFGRR